MLSGIVTTRFLCIAALLPILCICGDAYVRRRVSLWSRAICDSTVHAAVASTAWLAVTADRMTLLTILQSALCGLLSSAVDLDHFIAAGSFSLQAALSLENRPVLHNSTLMLVFNLCAVAICQFLHSSKIIFRTAVILLCCIFAVAWTTHHLRDGLRHGIWIAPFGHTSPLPNGLYLAATAAVPLTVRSLLLTDETSTDHGPQLLDV